VLAEDDVVEDAARTEDVADGVGFGRHVLDVDDLGGHVPWGSTPHKQVVGVVGHSCQPEIDDNRLLAQDNVVWLEVTMDHVFPGHLGKSAQNPFEDEFALVDGVLGEVVEPAADGVALDILQSQVD